MNSNPNSTGTYWDKGLGHVYIRPHRPRLNGKGERSHRIDEEGFYRLLDGVIIDDTNLFNDNVREWESFYNDSELMQDLNGQTPYERFRRRLGFVCKRSISVLPLLGNMNQPWYHSGALD